MPRDEDRDDTELKVAIAEMRKDVSYLISSVDKLTRDYETRIRTLEASDRKWVALTILVSAAFTVALKFLF